MKKYVIAAIASVVILLTIPKLGVSNNLFPCEYIYKDYKNIELSEKIFDELIISIDSYKLLNKIAIFKILPSFNPETVYILHERDQEYFIKRVTINENIFGLIQLVCHDLDIDIKDLESNIKIVNDKIKSLTITSTSEIKISLSLAGNLQKLFQNNIKTSRVPTESEADEYFSCLDGSVFYFKSPNGECHLGLRSMTSPPASIIIEAVMSLEGLFSEESLTD